MALDDNDLETTSEERAAARHAEERRAVEEAGGGESEGFEQSEELLIEHASHGDQHGTGVITRDAIDDGEDPDSTYAESDSEDPEDL